MQVASQSFAIASQVPERGIRCSPPELIDVEELKEDSLPVHATEKQEEPSKCDVSVYEVIISDKAWVSRAWNCIHKAFRVQHATLTKFCCCGTAVL